MSGEKKPTVDFYFDFISHNAYLAWHELKRLTRQYDHALHTVPVLFAGFLKAHGQLGPAEIPPKIAWMNRNTLRKAAMLEIPYKAPYRHPFNPLLLLRMATQELDDAERAQLCDCLFKAVWVDRVDASDEKAILAYVEAQGLSGARIISAASSPPAKSRLKLHTDEAIARGVFGVPTMVLHDEVFWGYDDLAYLECVMAGSDPLSTVDVDSYEQGWDEARARGQHR